MQLRVHQDGEVEEDGEGQVEVEREEVESRRDAHGWYVDGVRLKNILSHEVRVTQHQEVYRTARSTCRAHMCSLRVSWFVYLCLLM